MARYGRRKSGISRYSLMLEDARESGVYGQVKKHTIRKYESLAEFSNDAAKYDNYRYRSSGSWTDGESYEDSERMTLSGNDTLVSEALELLDQISDASEGEYTREWTASPMGAYPIVPEFLAGMPFCMRTVTEVPEMSPVNIYVSTTTSGGISADTLKRRGVAIVALVLKLQKTRPVNLYLTCELGARLEAHAITLLIPMQSNPISLAHVCYCMTSAGFARNLTYSVANHYGSQGTWNPMYDAHKNTPVYDKWLKAELGCNETDLYIPSAFMRDEMVSNPVEWVNAQLKKYNTGEYSEAENE